MLQDIILKGSTDKSVRLRIIDSTDGTPETGVVFNTAGIDLWYRRELAAKVSITEATLAALTTAHADGGFLHIGDGYYRLDLPDAAFATGANYVEFGGTVTGMVVIGGVVKLIDSDIYHDAVRGGLSALPNAAADAAGGLIISDAGGLDADAQRSDIAAILVDTGTTLDGRIPAALVSGRMDASVGAMAANVLTATAIAADAITAAKIAADAIGASELAADAVTEIQSGLSTLTAAGVRTAVGLASANLDTQLAAVQADTDDIQARLPAALTANGNIKADALRVGGTLQTGGDLAAALTIIDDFLDTEIAAIKAKTDNLPSDPADASDIATSFTAVNTKLDTIDDFLDTEIAAIKAKTDNLPAAPAATGDIPTAAQNAAALLDLANGIETSITPRQAIRLMLAAAAGKLSGAATTTITIRNVGDSKDRITATVDADGNRSAVTTDAT